MGYEPIVAEFSRKRRITVDPLAKVARFENFGVHRTWWSLIPWRTPSFEFRAEDVVQAHVLKSGRDSWLMLGSHGPSTCSVITRVGTVRFVLNDDRAWAVAATITRWGRWSKAPWYISPVLQFALATILGIGVGLILWYGILVRLQ